MPMDVYKAQVPYKQPSIQGRSGRATWHPGPVAGAFPGRCSHQGAQRSVACLEMACRSPKAVPSEQTLWEGLETQPGGAVPDSQVPKQDHMDSLP